MEPLHLSNPPARPKIYHITHMENLRRILVDGALYSHANMNNRGGPQADIGMSKIKKRRLASPVKCHPNTAVGQYVPFNFCPRSVMLYVIHRADHPELNYRGGQEPIIHLECDLHNTIAWAEKHSVIWAYSLRNASTAYVEFDSTLEGLGGINWDAVNSNDFKDSDILESKQAEFLIYERFPWSLVERVGAQNVRTKASVDRQIASVSHRQRWFRKSVQRG